MSLAPWLILALAVLLVIGLIGFVWWRRRRHSFSACPRCMTVFDKQRWKTRNIREHYQGRYTIMPVFVCPKCGFELTFATD